MKRGYVQNARARAAAENAERILDAGLACFLADFYDDVTLDKIAADAGVTVQTVIRRFGSKDGLVEALAARSTPAVEAQRSTAPVGDIPGAVANLVDHYEGEAPVALHLLRQEERVPAFARLAASGKKLHAEWCARVFAPWLDVRSGAERDRLLAQVVAVCDVYTWHLLRQQRRLSRRQCERALVELLEGILR